MRASLALIICAISVVAAAPSVDELSSRPFQDRCLEVHNAYRRKHGAPDLMSDPTVIRYAKSRAQDIADGDSFSTVRSNYGENLFMFYGSNREPGNDCEKAVTSWYKTNKEYDYDNPESSSNFQKAGTFTQVVWKSTSKLGCAQAVSSNSGRTYTVCNYSTPGNYHGRFGDNVGRPESSSKRN